MALLNIAIGGIPLLVIVVILIWLFRREVLGNTLEKKNLKTILFIFVFLILASIIARFLFTYFSLKPTSLGPYLLKDRGYIISYIYAMLSPYLYGALAGLILMLAGYLAATKMNRPLFEMKDYYIIFLTSFVVGFPNVLILIIGSLILMLFSQILARKADNRVSMAPYLLIAAIFILILNNFSFYLKFLNLLHLV